MTSQAVPTPATTPRSAEAAPSTTAWASTVRRRTGVCAPFVAARASVRRCRAALTAKAGPTRSVVDTRSITAASPTISPVRWRSPEVRSATSAGTAEAGGGCWSTSAEVTRNPERLRSSTSGQVTGSWPRTIQPPSPGTPSATGPAVTRPGVDHPSSASAVPTSCRVRAVLRTVTSTVPRSGRPRSVHARVTSASAGRPVSEGGGAGQCPEVSRSLSPRPRLPSRASPSTVSRRSPSVNRALKCSSGATSAPTSRATASAFANADPSRSRPGTGVAASSAVPWPVSRSGPCRTRLVSGPSR